MGPEDKAEADTCEYTDEDAVLELEEVKSDVVLKLEAIYHEYKENKATTKEVREVLRKTADHVLGRDHDDEEATWYHRVMKECTT